jgi:hypothetical protein
MKTNAARQCGGATALACKKDYPTYVDETIALFEAVSVSAGVRGTQIASYGAGVAGELVMGDATKRSPGSDSAQIRPAATGTMGRASR